MDDMLAPALRDLRATCATPAEIRTDRDGVWLLDEDGIGQLLRPARDEPVVDIVARFADQAQEWAVEALWRAGRAAVWPECPAHPNAHPLAATVVHERAVWSCPRSGDVVAEIGAL